MGGAPPPPVGSPAPRSQAPNAQALQSTHLTARRAAAQRELHGLRRSFLHRHVRELLTPALEAVVAVVAHLPHQRPEGEQHQRPRVHVAGRSCLPAAVPQRAVRRRYINGFVRAAGRHRQRACTGVRGWREWRCGLALSAALPPSPHTAVLSTDTIAAPIAGAEAARANFSAPTPREGSLMRARPLKWLRTAVDDWPCPACDQRTGFRKAADSRKPALITPVQRSNNAPGVAAPARSRSGNRPALGALAAARRHPAWPGLPAGASRSRRARVHENGGQRTDAPDLSRPRQGYGKSGQARPDDHPPLLPRKGPAVTRFSGGAIWTGDPQV
jgi:hypothetical protein